MCGGHTSEGGGSSGCHTGTMGFGAGFGFGAAMLLKWLQQHAQHAGGGRAAGGQGATGWAQLAKNGRVGAVVVVVVVGGRVGGPSINAACRHD